MVEKRRSQVIPEDALDCAFRESASLCTLPLSCSQLLSGFNHSLGAVINLHAPEVTSCARTHTGSWCSMDLKVLKQSARRAEAQWWKHRLDKDFSVYKERIHDYHAAIHAAKKSYWQKN